MSQRDRRKGGNQRDNVTRGPPAPVTAESLLQEAETLQQRAERRSGRDAVPAFEAAANKYQEALDAGLDAANTADAYFGLGECLQLLADQQSQLLQQAPDEQLSQAQQCQQLQQHIMELYQRSVQAYQQVQAEPDGSSSSSSGTQLRTDAAVNAANALTSWAELIQEQQQQQQQLLQQAVQLYRSALQQEEDALTLSNLGDALVSLGESLLATEQSPEGQAAFSSAMESYQASCSLCDSSAGDDLPGLLHNWGVGLHTISKHAQNLQLKQSLLEQAAQKLRSSIEFSRADPTPHNALGDVLMDAAELVVTATSSSSSSNANSSSSSSSSVFGGSAMLPAPVADQAAGLIKQAVDDGYMAALTINRTNADALVGLAEANVAMAKLALRQANKTLAESHIQAALGYYSSALQRPHLLGNASERADVRYNAACTAALAGQVETARQLLEGLAAVGRLQVQEVMADDDLACLKDQPWFSALVQQIQQPSG